jgi:ribonuclease HI
MEMQAALQALKSLSDAHKVKLYTDSQYLRKGITQWLPTWKQRNWQTATNTEVKNQDLWQALDSQLSEHQISWQWTKGHAGNKWNERADELAAAAIPTIPLPLDDENAIHIFTAASYLYKAKQGGWGVILRYRTHTKALSGSASHTSAHRMYLQAAVEGLQSIKRPLPIHLYTTSDYLKDGATIWCRNWIKRNWQTSQGKAVSHRDLWQTIVELMQAYQVNWYVVDRNKRPDEMMEAKKLASAKARGESSQE